MLFGKKIDVTHFLVIDVFGSIGDEVSNKEVSFHALLIMP
jgi:hypothetical protein